MADLSKSFSHFHAGCALASFLCAGGLAWSQSPDGETGETAAPAQVIIVSMQSCCSLEAWPEAEKLTQAEFAALGFGVKVVDGSAMGEAERRVELEKAAVAENGVCALRIIRSPEGAGGGVDLWISDRVTGKTTFRHLCVERESEGEAASVIAIRVVELLRASLLELKIEGSPKGEVAPLPEVTDMIESAAPEEEERPPEAKPEKKEGKIKDEGISGPVGLRLGVEVLGSPSGLGIMGGIDAAVRWRFMSFLSIEIDVLLSLLGKDIRSGASGASFNLTVVRGWLAWEILARGVVRLSLGAGGGALIAWASGYASESIDVRTDLTGSGWVGGSLQAAFVLMKSLWLRVGFTAGASLPRIAVMFSGEKVATFGPALLEGFVGIEGRIP